MARASRSRRSRSDSPLHRSSCTESSSSRYACQPRPPSRRPLAALASLAGAPPRPPASRPLSPRRSPSQARNRPALKQLSGPLALHVSHREEPFGSPLVSTAVAILRRRYTDEAISSLFALPQTHAQGHGCIVGIVDVEATWPADLFNEVEQSQLTEQAAFPVGGTYITQLRNPRWLKYPIRTSGSNKLWQAQIPLDALPDGTEVDGHGNLICTALRDQPPLYQPGSAAALIEGDDLGLGLLGGDMVRQLQSADEVGEREKKLKKLQKALRQIDELKMKQASGVQLERTQEGKIDREEELRNELADLLAQPDTDAPPL